MIYQKTKRNEGQCLYYRSMGKVFRVACIAQSDEEVNRYCATHRDTGVIGQLDDLVVIVEFYGETIRIDR